MPRLFKEPEFLDLLEQAVDGGAVVLVPEPGDADRGDDGAMGLEAIAGDEDAPQVTVTFHSYQLQPDAEVDFDGTHDDYLAKYVGMSPEQAVASAQHITDLGQRAGLDYHFERMQQTNTLQAHQLVHFAKTRGLQHEMKERLMAAHFIEGRHVGHTDDLVELAAEVGLDAAETRAALESEQYLRAVQHDMWAKREVG